MLFVQQRIRFELVVANSCTCSAVAAIIYNNSK